MAWPIARNGEQIGPNKHIWARRIFPFALFLLALLPRLAAINRYITPDELLWVYRSVQFREALASGRWADTLVAGHPGVTTTWLGAAGMSAQLALDPAARSDYEWVTKLAALLPDNVAAFQRLAGLLSAGRLAVAAVTSLSIVLVFSLASRLWGFGVAALAALLLALDPFAAGLSGLLHVDALSASFALVSLLALGLAATMPDDTGHSARFMIVLALSGTSAALAILTKTPALVLGVVAAMAFAVWYISLGGSLLSPSRQRLLAGIVIWGASLGLAALVALPALWADPGNVWRTVSGNANRHLDEALRPTFFMGRVAFDHGFLFYPVVMLWRNGPVVVAAFVPLVLLAWHRKRPQLWRMTGQDSVLPVALLTVWVILFGLLISAAAKKFDRYALPAILPLIVLAALVWFVWWRKRGGRWPWALVLIQTAYLLAFIAYPLSAYNPLVGGPFTAARVLPAGWGEAISAAGRWLSATQPQAASETAMAGVPPSLAPFFAGQTLVEGNVPAAAADFVVHTLGGQQVASTNDVALGAEVQPIETIRYGGLDQAWIYRNPSPIPVPQPSPLTEPIVFGERMALTAATVTYQDDLMRVAAAWSRLTELAREERFTVRIVITDDRGNLWATTETDLLNAVHFYPPDWEESASGTVHYALELPAAAPPGEYTAQLTVVDARTQAQLPARSADGSFEGVAVELGTAVVPRPDEVISAVRVQIPQPADAFFLDGDLQLLGTSALPPEALAGGRIPVDLFWHAPEGGLPGGLGLRWSLEGIDSGLTLPLGESPVSSLDTASWRAGETVHEKINLRLPPETQPGRYGLALTVVGEDGQNTGAATQLGTIQVNNIDRSFELPAAAAPLAPHTCFGDALCLEGIDPGNVILAPGTESKLTLFWQAQAAMDSVYTVFFHVVNAAGDIVIQADHWPGGLPTDILATGQVVTDRVVLPVPDLAPGSYGLRVGLYSASNGARLPVTTSSLPAGEDYLLLPDYFAVPAP